MNGWMDGWVGVWMDGCNIDPPHALVERTTSDEIRNLSDTTGFGTQREPVIAVMQRQRLSFGGGSGPLRRSIQLCPPKASRKALRALSEDHQGSLPHLCVALGPHPRRVTDAHGHQT